MKNDNSSTIYFCIGIKVVDFIKSIRAVLFLLPLLLFVSNITYANANTVNFGNVNLNESNTINFNINSAAISGCQYVYIKNIWTTDNAFKIDPKSDYCTNCVLNGNCPSICTYDISFSPLSTGPQSAYLYFEACVCPWWNNATQQWYYDPRNCLVHDPFYPTLLVGNGIITKHQLLVNMPGMGQGTVFSYPSGICCGTSCSPSECTAQFDNNTAVTLWAIPDASSSFSGWQGGCSGIGECLVALTGDTHVEATFDKVTYELIVAKTGIGVGTVASDPSGICCGDDCSSLCGYCSCSNSFDANTSIILSSVPGTNSIFEGWASGACSGTESCSFKLTGPIDVTGNFEPAMEVPSTKASYTVPPVALPILSFDPATAIPMAVGNIGGGLLNLKVGLPQFTKPVDVYLAVVLPSSINANNDLWMIGPGSRLWRYSESGLVPWMTNVSGPIDASLYGDIPLTSLPSGEYALYAAVVPSRPGGPYSTWDVYYLWNSSFINACSTMCVGCSSNNTPVGSSANLAVGNLYHSQNILSRPQSLAFSIVYNSKDAYDGPLGLGWTHNYNMAINKVLGVLTFMKADGKRVAFKQDGSSVFYPEDSSGEHLTLINNPDGTFTLSTKEGTIYNFNPGGKLTSIIDRNGNSTILAYSNNDLVSITDGTGRFLQLSYNSLHQLTQIQASGSQNIVTLSYGSESRLSSIMDGGGNTWHYSYDTSGKMIRKTDPGGNLVTYTYDSAGRLSNSITPSGAKTLAYNAEGNSSTVIERDGGQWTYEYDSNLNVPTVVTDPTGGKTVKTYDMNGNRLTTTNPDGNKTTYSYDGTGNMNSVLDASGHTTTYTYNSFGQTTSIKDPQGAITNYTHDSTGNLTAMTNPAGEKSLYTYDVKGNMISSTDATGQTTAYTYDQHNNIVSISDPSGAITRFTFDSMDNLTSQTDPSGDITQYKYDILNQLSSVIDPSGKPVSYTYDANGNRISITDANGNTTRYEYNHNRQVTKVINALGDVTFYTYGSSSCPSCGSGADKLTAITDADGNTTTYSYDTLGDLIKETDPSGRIISYSYDSSSNLVEKTDAKGVTVRYTHDPLKRLTAIIYPDATQNVIYTYDAAGRVLTMNDQTGTTTYSYDAAGRLIYETRTTDGIGYDISYTYTASGALSSIIYPSGRTVLYSLDAMGRMIGVTESKDGITQSIISNVVYNSNGAATSIQYGNGLEATKGYDVRGALNSLIIGNYRRLSYTRDGVGNITSISDAIDSAKSKTYIYDSLYRLTQASGPWGTIQYGYDPTGNRTVETTGAGTTNYSYSANKLLTSSGVKSFTFAYDNNGNAVSENQRQYIYNQNQRLIKAVENSKILGEYLYNGNGQRSRKTVNGKTTYFIYDQFGNLIEEIDEMGRPISDYIYFGRSPIGRLDIQYDLTPPTSTATVGSPQYQNASGLYVAGGTTITLAAADAGDYATGVDYTEYKVDTEALWTKYSTPFILGGYPENVHSISYRSMDKAGNLEDAKTLVVILDKTAPVSSKIIGDPQYQVGDNLFIAAKTTITLYATDSLSGVSKSEYSIEGGSYILYSGPFTLGGKKDGPYVINYHSTDNVLNVETDKVAVVTLDATPPVTTISASDPLADGVLNTVSPRTRFYLSSSDKGSGVKEIQYRIDNGTWNTYVAGFPLGAVAGMRTIGYRAIDNLGNEEGEKQLTVRMIVVDISKGVSQEPVILGGAWGSSPSSHLAIRNLQRILASSGLSYYIPRSEDDFKASLRNGRYNAYVLVDFRNEELIEEMREAVHYGDGLVYIKTDPDTIPKLEDVFGVRFNGLIVNRGQEITLLESEISKAGRIRGFRKAVRTSITSPTAVSLGDIEDRRETHPVIISNEYGRGKVILVAFDLLNLQERNNVSSLVINSLKYVTPEERYIRALGEEPIRIKLRNSSEPADLTVTETISAKTSVDTIRPSGTQNGNNIRWQFTLGANESKTLGYWLLLPDNAGDYPLDTEVRYNNQGNYRLYGNSSLSLTVEVGSAELLREIVADLSVLILSQTDYKHVGKALAELSHVTKHAPNRKAAESNIARITGALREIGEVSIDISLIRIKLDELLKIWQKKWSLLPEEKDREGEKYSWMDRFRLVYETDARKIHKEVGQVHKLILLASSGSVSGLLNPPSKDKIYYYHTDHLGTPIIMTDNSGNKVWEGEFFPFGEEFSISGKVANNLRFPGQYYDQETGLHYNGRRDYQPRIGRYLEKDPIGLNGGNVNLYLYVDNNAAGFTDPLGLAKTCSCTVTFSAVGPNQATGVGALGIVPPNDSVAISPASFGLAYNTIRERTATQKVIRNNIGNIKIYAPGLSQYLSGGTTFTIGDVGDSNIRNSPTTRFDIYRFATKEDALCFGTHAVPVTITGVPDDWACPK